MGSDIKPYTVAVPDEALAKLKSKLNAVDLPQHVDFENDWNYGAPAADVRRLATYWRDGFDWRAQEKKINQLPQFTTPIDVDGFGTLNIHFVHQKSAHAGSIPLLFCHGCRLRTLHSSYRATNKTRQGRAASWRWKRFSLF